MPKKIETIESIHTGTDNLSQAEIESLGVGAPKYYDFENPKAKDPNFEYRWCNPSDVAVLKSEKYATVTKEEFDRIKPFFGEWIDGACHLFKGSKKHMILMRCSKVLFEKRREYYGQLGRNTIEADKESLKEAGRAAWKKGDSIGPDEIVKDERET